MNYLPFDCLLARSLARWPRSALDVIVVTKEGTSSLHGYEDAGSDKPAQKKRATGAANSPSPTSNAVQEMDVDDDDDDDDDENLTSEEEESSDDDNDDDDDHDLVEVEASGKKAGGKASTSSRGGRDKGGVLAEGENKKGREGGRGGVGGKKKGGRVKGNERLFDWQVGEKDA